MTYFKSPRDIASSTQSSIKQRDIKKLCQNIKKSMCIDDATMKSLIPNKSKVICRKTKTKLLVYFIGTDVSVPMFFSNSPDDVVFPTVYCLWKYSSLLQVVSTPSPVSKRIINGASLMLPGMLPPLRKDGSWSMHEGEPCSIAVINNPLPFAVGYTLMSSEDMIKLDMKGRGVEIVHCYGDELWALGGKVNPNDGFCGSIVLELESDFITTGAAAVNKTKEANIKKILENGDDDNIIPPDMDAMIELCFFQSIASRVKDKDLPLLANIYFSNYFLPCRPAGVTLDLKKSQYKKLSKLLVHMKNEGVVRLKDENGVLQITDINWTHVMLKQHSKWSKDNEIGTIEAKKISDMAPATFHPPTFDDVFAPSKRLVPIFTSIEASVSGRESYYTAFQVRDILDQYERKYNLIVSMKKSHINPNEALSEALYKGIRKKEAYPFQVSRSDAATQFMQHMKKYHSVVSRDGGSPTYVKGSVKHVEIETEPRQGGRKHISTIMFLETFNVPIDMVVKDIARLFACSCTTTNISMGGGGKALISTTAIQLQGDFMEGIKEYLESEFKIPSRFITCTKLKKQKKR